MSVSNLCRDLVANIGEWLDRRFLSERELRLRKIRAEKSALLNIILRGMKPLEVAELRGLVRDNPELGK